MAKIDNHRAYNSATGAHSGEACTVETGAHRDGYVARLVHIDSARGEIQHSTIVSLHSRLAEDGACWWCNMGDSGRTAA